MDVGDEQLRKILDSIDEAPDDQMRLRRFRKLQEIFQLIQLANDECDFGMGLEFGISLFAHGQGFIIWPGENQGNIREFVWYMIYRIRLPKLSNFPSETPKKENCPVRPTFSKIVLLDRRQTRQTRL